MTLFGTSAKFIDAVRKSGIVPRETHPSERAANDHVDRIAARARELRLRLSRDQAPDVHLASISGGTDIVSCFVGGNPNGPVWRGEIQGPGLGMDVDVFDSSGQAARRQAPGSSSASRRFPRCRSASGTIPTATKYHAAYFDRFPGVWCHGDWISRTEHGGFIIYGRSDATLNPGGVRIGTAEIYRQVEQLPEVVESLAVGQQLGRRRAHRPVRPARGRASRSTTSCASAIAQRIRANTSPRHVPARIVQVADIPRTKSGKIVELAVRNVIHGRDVTNREALANPEALDLFRNLSELQS